LTGSYETAAAIKSRLPVEIPFQAELGGKNTLVIWDDADLGKAIEIIKASSFRNNGQICTSAGRILVHENIYDSLLARLSDVVTEMADASNDDELGILVSAPETDRVEAFVALAESEAEQIIRPARWRDGRVAPTLLVEPKTGALTAEEIFGPVVTIERVTTMEETIAKANATEYGLTSGIVTADLAAARQFWKESHAGTVKVNSPLTGVPFHVPFEGYGHSGAGWAEGGQSSLDFFTRTKTVFVRS
jgi:acyl-CoA reductase-like NAD-dependent aldehyde dehydrogenase